MNLTNNEISYNSIKVLFNKEKGQYIIIISILLLLSRICYSISSPPFCYYWSWLGNYSSLIFIMMTVAILFRGVIFTRRLLIDLCELTFHSLNFGGFGILFLFYIWPLLNYDCWFLNNSGMIFIIIPVDWWYSHALFNRGLLLYLWALLSYLTVRWNN